MRPSNNESKNESSPNINLIAPNGACLASYNGDTDIDGEDLGRFILNFGGLGLDKLALNFGKDNC
jgi:hypothetical protein